MAAKHPFGAIKFNSVVYLGAGNGESLNELLAQVQADHWHLVEGDRKIYKRLQQATDTLESNDKIKLHNCVVSDDGTQKTWFSYNLGEFSGLKKAKDLAKLFPGIKLKHQTAVDTEALPNFLEQLELTSKENNLLIIDLPGQVLELIEAILKAGQKPLFSQLVLTATKERVFEHGGTLERIQQWLDKQGYHTRNEPYDDPDFPVLYYSFDKHSAAEFTKLKRQLKQLVKERDEAVARASTVSYELKELKLLFNKKIDQANHSQSRVEELERLLAQGKLDRTMIAEEFEKVCALVSEVKKDGEKLHSQLMEQKSVLDNELEIRHAALKSYIHKNMEIMKFFITKSLTKNAKQTESFISLDQYLTHDKIPLNFHGWPISPDIALFITGLFKREKVDYVIEFGSGTSTILFAKLFQKTDLHEKKNRILSFEHHIEYLKETEYSIKEHSVDSIVNLCHAPLIPLPNSKDNKLYYDCNEQLLNFKRAIGQNKSVILILVDGPPGNLGEKSRFPAMDAILSCLSNHKLIFVVDDYQRKDEKKMVDEWIDILESRKLTYQLQEVDLEKGGALIRVN